MNISELIIDKLKDIDTKGMISEIKHKPDVRKSVIPSTVGYVVSYISELKMYVAISVKNLRRKNINENTYKYIKNLRDLERINIFEIETQKLYFNNLNDFIIDFPHSGLEEFMSCKEVYYDDNEEYNKLHYCVLYIRYPFIEQLVKAGFGGIICSLDQRDIDTDFTVIFNADGKDIHEICGLTDFEWQHVIEHVDNFDDYKSISSLIKSYKFNESQLRRFLNLNNDFSQAAKNYDYAENFEYILNQTYRDKKLYSIDTLLNYLNRCKTKQGLSPARALNLLRDYNSMCIALDIAPKYKPENLVKEHDVTSKQYALIKEKDEEAKLQSGFDSQYRKLKQFEYHDNRLEVVIPRKVKDIYDEGRNNNNCVGSYASRHARGQSNILFIRKIADRNNSYITVELSKSLNRVVQAYYAHNRPLNKTDKEFIHTWLKEVKSRKEN